MCKFREVFVYASLYLIEKPALYPGTIDRFPGFPL